MSDSPYKPSESMTLGGPEPEREKLRRVAKHQRLVIFSLLASIGTNILAFAMAGQPTAVQLGILALSLGVVAFTMVSIYLLAAELINAGIGVLCAVLMFVPCISLIVLLVINQKATAFLQSNGIRVGFLGTSPDKI